jgi:hypothetical protein
MPQYRPRPVEIDAEQFFYDGPTVRGVFYPPTENGTYIGDAFVITMHEQRVYVQNGDWIIAEPDGEHYYPCKDEVFRKRIDADPQQLGVLVWDAMQASARAEAAEAKLELVSDYVAYYVTAWEPFEAAGGEGPEPLDFEAWLRTRKETQPCQS